MQAAEQLIVIDGYCRGPGRCRIGTHLDEEIDPDARLPPAGHGCPRTCATAREDPA